MSEVVTIKGLDFELCQCGTCGVLFIVAQEVRNLQRRQGGFSHCPNGHQWGFRKDNCEEERTRRERDLLKQRLAQASDQLDAEQRMRQRAEEREAQIKTKLKNATRRAAAAVCPCCNRSFVALRRHLATKHPDYTCEAV